METSNKVVLFVLTIVLDIIIIMALNVKNMEKFDMCYAFAVLIIHGIFIISLILDTRALLDILHYSIFIFIALSPLLSDIYLISANLLLVIVIQILWILKGCCILNDPNNPIRFGYGYEISIFVLLYTVILANKMPKLDISNLFVISNI